WPDSMTSANLSNALSVLFFFFFFQAEDGIRDFHVTGVQTCALPILFRLRPDDRHAVVHVAGTGGPEQRRCRYPQRHLLAGRAARSEERRVGKECRSRWSRAQ